MSPAPCRRRRRLPPAAHCPRCPHGLQLALAVGGELKKKKRLASQAAKKDISKGAAPLKASPAPGASGSSSRPGRTFRQAWRKTAGELSEAEQRTAVLQALEVFRQLPPASTYAQHRIRVLEKVLQLLDKAAG